MPVCTHKDRTAHGSWESRHSMETPVRAFLLESFPGQSQLPATSGHAGKKTRENSWRTQREQPGALAVLLPVGARSPGVTCQWADGREGLHPPVTVEVASSPVPGCPSLAAA